MIFVFGSNEAGIHGKGAAKHAVEKEGAVMGVGFGPQGNSFAIPTKTWTVNHMSRAVISNYVQRFIAYAEHHPQLGFQVTAIGCGLAGWHHQDIAPMFEGAPDNCFYDMAWKRYLGEGRQYWGSYD